MMGYKVTSKKAIKDAIKAAKEIGGHDVDEHYRNTGAVSILDFRRNVQHTSFFHGHLPDGEANIPGENTVVGPDAYTNRKWYATLTVNEHGIVTAIR